MGDALPGQYPAACSCQGIASANQAKIDAIYRGLTDVKKMKKRSLILLIISSGVIILVIAGLFFIMTHEDFYKILITTDKRDYQVGETIRIRIQNWDDRTIDIYCPLTCALGNFPTTVEKLTHEEWGYYAGFCPSIEPLFADYQYEDGYIIHSLPPGDSYELEISNLEALQLKEQLHLRIMYYLKGGRGTIYSDEFTVKP